MKVWPDGNLEIVGRTKEMFISGGFNIYPREIEMTIEEHPATGLVAVLGVTDEVFGEVGHAFVEAKPGMPLTAEDLVPRAAGQLQGAQGLRDHPRHAAPAHWQDRQAGPAPPIGRAHPMIDAGHASLMADYNGWMNARLYDLCSGLTDEERRRDRGAFFRSLHATLNHILCIDLIFLHRFTGEPATPPGLYGSLAPDFEGLQRLRRETDARIVAWAATLEPDLLARSTTFASIVDGKTRTVPLWVMVTQMFNHQTHHRGQTTTLLAQMGHDIGTTDIPFMPRFKD